MDYRLWRLVVCNLRFVVWMTPKYPRLGVEIDDLIQEGNLGLVLAAPRFDTSRGTRYLTYAGYWVQQRILRALSENCSLIRWPTHMVEELTRANLDGDCASLPAGQRFVESLSHVRESRIVGIAAGDEPTAAAERSIVRQPIMKAVGTLKPKYRTVMVLRYGLDGGGERTLREIGKAAGFTGARVQQIVKKCLGILEKRIPKSVRDSIMPRRDRPAAKHCRRGLVEPGPVERGILGEESGQAPLGDSSGTDHKDSDEVFDTHGQVPSKECMAMQNGDSEVTVAFRELLKRLEEAVGNLKSAGAQAIQSGELDRAVEITNRIREADKVAKAVKQAADQWADAMREDELPDGNAVASAAGTGTDGEEEAAALANHGAGQGEDREGEEISEEECRALILRALVNLGCKAPADDVLRRAYETEQHPPPRTPWPGPPHWRERAMKCGKNLLREGFLNGSPDGKAWEITYKGWEYHQKA
jgi:RNA polymerase primary sigma factor